MTSRHRPIVATIVVVIVPSIASCGGETVDVAGSISPTPTDTTSVVESAPRDADTNEDLDFPEILAVEAAEGDDGLWSFAVTIASPYDAPEQYADGWRVVGPDGTVYGEHTLTHDHANEQPFTRRQTGVEIPDDIAEVTIEGRDLVNGFGGPTQTVSLDRG